MVPHSSITLSPNVIHNKYPIHTFTNLDLISHQFQCVKSPCLAIYSFPKVDLLYHLFMRTWNMFSFILTSLKKHKIWVSESFSFRVILLHYLFTLLEHMTPTFSLQYLVKIMPPLSESSYPSSSYDSIPSELSSPSSICRAHIY